MEVQKRFLCETDASLKRGVVCTFIDLYALWFSDYISVINLFNVLHIIC